MLWIRYGPHISRHPQTNSEIWDSYPQTIPINFPTYVTYKLWVILYVNSIVSLFLILNSLEP
jgi:hypothetical protein